MKIEGPTLVILASKLKRGISSCLAKIFNNPYERKSKPNLESIEL